MVAIERLTLGHDSSADLEFFKEEIKNHSRNGDSQNCSMWISTSESMYLQPVAQCVTTTMSAIAAPERTADPCNL